MTVQYHTASQTITHVTEFSICSSQPSKTLLFPKNDYFSTATNLTKEILKFLLQFYLRSSYNLHKVVTDYRIGQGIQLKYEDLLHGRDYFIYVELI